VTIRKQVEGRDRGLTELLRRKLPGGIQESHQTPQSISGPRLEATTFQIKSISSAFSMAA
jgi:hypothetical protein